MIEVFKTNVYEAEKAQELISVLLQHFPGSRINFDLEDCDKVLRVEGRNFTAGRVMELVNENGYHCTELE